MVERNKTTVAFACQGDGSHIAFTAGVLKEILRNCSNEYEIGALSGTSGGAMSAALAWMTRDYERKPHLQHKND